MEENNVQNIKKNNNIALYIIVVLIGILLGVGAFFIFGNKDSKPNNVDNKEKNTNSYISINEKDMLRSDLKLTDNAKVESLKKDGKNNIVIVNIVEPDFQFETHYLLCFDKDYKLIFEARDLYDKDNDDNRYKYNGKFEYDEDNKTLTFYTRLFLGESDEATGKAFSDKDISELTSDELKTLGNYSDEVKYEYKYENNEFNFAGKTEVSKLKTNEYYKEYFSDNSVDKKTSVNQEMLDIGLELYKFATGNGFGPSFECDDNSKITVGDVSYTLITNYDEVAAKFTRAWIEGDHNQFPWPDYTINGKFYYSGVGGWLKEAECEFVKMEIKNYDESKVDFVVSYYSQPLTGGDKELKTSNFTVKKENNEWKIDYFDLIYGIEFKQE